MVLGISIELETGARTFQIRTLPVPVPAAMKRARCPGMSVGFEIGSVGDIGVSDGEDAVDRPEKLSSGSPEKVCEAMLEASNVVAVISILRRPPSDSLEVRHPSIMGRGVMDPAMSSCDSESSRLSKENDDIGAVIGESGTPNNEGEVEP